MTAGDRIGAWVLEKRLGRGMTAATWIAVRADGNANVEAGSTASSGAAVDGSAATGRDTAVLKVIDVGDLHSWNVVDLFRREADALRRLDHPDIPKYIDSFEDQSEGKLRLVLVMERIQGENLEEVVRNRRTVTESEVMSILAGLADILDYLGSIRPPVVHRDVNPKNVILRPDGTVALVDFSGAQDAVRTALHPGATLVGTAGYTPVEQVAGRATPRSDLYGAATTAVFLLTGKNPVDLPAKGMKIDIASVVDLSPPIGAVLDSWLESDPAKRGMPAREAAEILRGLRRPPAPANPGADGSTAHPDIARLAGVLGQKLAVKLADSAGLLSGGEFGPGIPEDSLPSDSRVRIDRADDRLTVVIPPVRRAAAAPGMLFSVFWLGFVAFWTFMAIAMGAPFFFPLFSIPFWAVGIFMARTFLKTAFGTTTILLDRGGITIGERLFGRGSERSWLISDLGDFRVTASNMQVQGHHNQELLIEAGTRQIRLGSGLSTRELLHIAKTLDRARRELRL